MLSTSRTRSLTLCWSFLILAGGAAAAQPPTPEPCVIDDPSPGVGGHFTAVVGAADEPATELAGFATSSGRAGAGWSVQVLTPGGANSILLMTQGAGRPDPGTYPVIDYVGADASPQPGQYVAAVALEQQLLGASGFFSVKGTFTVASSTPDAVAGCFTFSAADMQRTASVSVEGTFVAGNEDL
ncbi:MAG: hypothetical protein OEP45_13335 [Acidobacteriota bacterium]|nr:hypothetical protein [Acidobacteriota bacterium]